MANEFTRSESVSDYQVYAGREGSMVDYEKEAQKITLGVNAIADKREGRKADIQSTEDDVVNQLTKADSFENQTLGDTVLLAAKALKESVLKQSKLMKAGLIKPNDFMRYLQSAKDSIANWGIASKDWNKKYNLKEARQKNGPTGKVIASGMETAISESVLAFNNLNNVVPWVSPSGNAFLVTMNVDEETGEQSMPDWDTQRDQYGSMNNMNNLLLYQDDNAKYDISTLIKNETDNLGTFITSSITGYTVEEGGGYIITKEGSDEMGAYITSADGKKEYDNLVIKIQDVVLGDQLSIANILVDRSGGSTRYIIAQTEQEFVNKGGTDLAKWIRADYTTQPPSVFLEPGQEDAAKAYVKEEILTQLGQSSKTSGGKGGSSASATEIGFTEKQKAVGGFAAQVADVLTSDIANATAVVQGLITNVNDNLKAGAARIVDYRIDSDQIIFYREGDDPITVSRRATTGEIDDLTTDENEAYDDVELLNEVSSLYQKLTGEKANRTQIEEGLEAVKYDLAGKTKREKTLSGGLQRKAFDMITESQPINEGGDSILSLVGADIGGSTKGLVDWLWGDQAAADEINATLMKAIKPSILRHMANDDTLSSPKTKLFSNAEANTAIAAWAKTADGKRKLKEDPEFLSKRGADDEVVMIDIAGIRTPILLDRSLSKEKLSALIAEAINRGTQKVNKKRSAIDNRRSTTTSNLSVNDIQSKNPFKPAITGKPTPLEIAEYKKLIIDLYNDQ